MKWAIFGAFIAGAITTALAAWVVWWKETTDRTE